MNANDMFEAAMVSATNAEIRRVALEVMPQIALITASIILPALAVALIAWWLTERSN